MRNPNIGRIIEGSSKQAVSNNISYLMHELGYSQKRAIAAALNIAERNSTKGKATQAAKDKWMRGKRLGHVGRFKGEWVKIVRKAGGGRTLRRIKGPRRNPRTQAPVNVVHQRPPFESKVLRLLPKIDRLIKKGRMSAKSLSIKSLADYFRGQGVSEHELVWFFGDSLNDPKIKDSWVNIRNALTERGADLRVVMRGMIGSGSTPAAMSWSLALRSWDEEFGKYFEARTAEHIQSHKLDDAHGAYHFVTQVALSGAPEPGSSVTQHYKLEDEIIHLRWQIRTQPFLGESETPRLILYVDEIQSDRHEAVARGASYSAPPATKLPPGTEIVPFLHIPNKQKMADALFPKWQATSAAVFQALVEYLGGESAVQKLFKAYSEGGVGAGDFERALFAFWEAEDKMISFLQAHTTFQFRVPKGAAPVCELGDPAPFVEMEKPFYKLLRSKGIRIGAPKFRKQDVAGQNKFKYQLPGMAEPSTSHYSSEATARKAALGRFNKERASGVGWAPWPRSEQYGKLGLKVLLWLAVELGCDALALTTGAQQVMIYSNSADEVAVVDKGSPMTILPDGGLSYKNAAGNFVSVGPGLWAKDPIKTFGPQVGDAVAKAKASGGRVPLLPGVYPMRQGLTGMAQFYDGVLPAALARVVRPLGGKVERLIKTPLSSRYEDVCAINPGVVITGTMYKHFTKGSPAMDDFRLMFNPGRR